MFDLRNPSKEHPKTSQDHANQEELARLKLLQVASMDRCHSH
jgi:hypothetical protein